MQIKLVDKYLFKQVLAATAVCILLFTVIWIAPELLLKTIQRTLAGKYTIKMAIDILVFEVPKILGNALPVGLLLGSLFTFDKLSKDFELSILRGIGMSFWRILTPIIVLGSIFAVFSFFVFDDLIPYSTNKLNLIKNENRGSHFVFPVRGTDNRMDRIVIVSNFDNEFIRDVVVLNFFDSDKAGDSLLESIYISDHAVYTQGSWMLGHTQKYLISKEGVFEEISAEDYVEVLTDASADNAHKLMMYSVKRDRELTNSELFNYLVLLKKEKMDDEYRFMLNKYLQRYSHSFMCILFAIFGCILGFSQPRDQRLIGFTIAVLTIFLYYITMPFFDLLTEKDILPPVITSFIQPVVIIAVIAIFKKVKEL